MTRENKDRKDFIDLATRHCIQLDPTPVTVAQ